MHQQLLGALCLVQDYRKLTEIQPSEVLVQEGFRSTRMKFLGVQGTSTVLTCNPSIMEY
jgi:hypothetical protein